MRDRKITNYDRTEAILWQLAGKNNWEALECVDGWLNIYDKMPKRMKLAFDYKVQGYDVPEIAKIMKIAEVTVYEHLQKAKERIMNSIMI